MITFRKAELSDTAEINTLVNSAYRGEFAKKGWTTEAYVLDGQRVDPEGLKEMITDPGSQIELALENSVIVGIVHLSKEPNSLYFGMLTVHPLLQNKGLGKHILNRIEELALQWGYKKISMKVINGRKELFEFYERRGYRSTGKTEPFPSHDPRYGIPKTNDLEFLEFEKTLSS